jgi:hypothetical protein
MGSCGKGFYRQTTRSGLLGPMSRLVKPDRALSFDRSKAAVLELVE